MPTSTSTPNKTTSTKFLNSKSALPKPYTMWIRLWLTQKATPKKNLQAYTARSMSNLNKRGRSVAGVRIH